MECLEQDRLIEERTNCFLQSPEYRALEESGPERTAGLTSASVTLKCDGSVRAFPWRGEEIMLFPTRYRIGDGEPEEVTGWGWGSLFEADDFGQLIDQTLAFEAEGQYGSPVYTWRFQGLSRADAERLERACEQVQ